MHLRNFVAALVLSVCMLATSQAQELTTTTEFGITITPDNITDAIQETQDFWTPVLRYIASDDFAVADANMRKQVVGFFNRLHEALFKQLFEGDDANARDLLDYLCLRMRKMELYRQLRSTLKNDKALVAMMDRWERSYREIHLLAADQRPDRVKAMLALVPEQMQSLGISAEVSEKALKIWALQSECMTRMYKTDAGAIIGKFEKEARQMDRPVGELLRKIASSADWAMITKPEGKSASRPEFEKAWKALAELREQQLAATPAASAPR
ncbi:MAG TPA: hypothetical protein VHV55_21220 [Pirellulales bacterium]|jgi:hypothetical protein|nr:hypothetical protein [Pirellulales bacterium]